MKTDEREFKRYSECLKLADDLYHRAERTKANSRPTRKTLRNTPLHNRGLSSSGLLHRRAETAYERALQILKEVLDDYPYLWIYLDRQVIYDMYSYNLSSDPYGVPRLKISRSQYVIREQRRNQYDK
jgi:hypothetical protein